MSLLVSQVLLVLLVLSLFQSLDGKVQFVFKKVAVVERFFDIIYSVHVESSGETQLRGRAGKHCGQKRTYRAVSNVLARKPIQESTKQHDSCKPSTLSCQVKKAHFFKKRMKDSITMTKIWKKA